VARATGWIKKHQLIAFFLVCYALSWGAWLPVILTGIEILEILGLFGLFGPALACVLIARISEPEPKINTDQARWIAFGVAWPVVVLIFILNVMATSQIVSPVALVVFAVVGLTPAFIIASAFSKTVGVRKSLASLIRPPGGPGWYLLAICWVPGLRLLSIPISRALGWTFLSDPGQTGGWELIGLIVLSFLYLLIYSGGLNEETGWTGFALPRLQARYNPLIASVVLWFFWILWHMPLQLGGLWNPEIEGLIYALVGTFFARFVFTWLYIRTGGGLLTAIFFHASANVASQFIPLTYASLILEAIVAVIVILSSRMWQKLPDDSPAAYQAG
jgi:membrane protease YdiL (CAAX protease family)